MGLDDYLLLTWPCVVGLWLVGVVGLVYLLRGVVKVCAEVMNEWVWVSNSRLWRLFFSGHGVLIMFRSVGGLGRAWVCLVYC